MVLRCTHAFGNFKPGDEVEVPDGSEFDHAYFEQDTNVRPEGKETPKQKEGK